MLQEEISLKKDISLVVAVEAAGFKVSNNKSIPTDDGYAWRATLLHGRTKIVTVSNGGYGGDDQSHFHAATPAASTADRESLAKLFALPEVQTELRKHLKFEADLQREYSGLSDADYNGRKAKVYASTPAVNTSNVEFLVGLLGSATKVASEIKRELKTKLLFVLKGEDALSQYRWYTVPDTPANRAAAQQKQNGKIDYFVADLFAATAGAQA